MRRCWRRNISGTYLVTSEVRIAASDGGHPCSPPTPAPRFLRGDFFSVNDVRVSSRSAPRGRDAGIRSTASGLSIDSTPPALREDPR